MSLALYRKYRPAAFAELKGQEHVAEPLRQALRNGRVHHAYLFSGPRGCGKTSSARILARSLNCDEGPTPDPCGTCESCIALGPSGSGHIDVIEIDAASHGGVDDARDLRERAFFAPVSARFKVYIIDEAHMVTREGFNALLKLVEEPPPHLKFIFATTEPEKVIGTIRSRTHHYPFRLLPPGTLRELLEGILDEEKAPYEPAALPLVVRAGAGSARDSLSVLDQLLAGADEAGITHARAVSLLGYTDASLLDEVVDAIAGRDGAAVFAAIDRVIDGGQDPRRFAADLLERFRDLIVLSNVADAGSTGLLDAPSDEVERMRSQADRLGPAELSRAADLMHTGLTEMRGATSPRLLLELICARVLLPGASDDEASLLTRLERCERRLAISGDAPAPVPSPGAATAASAASPVTPSRPAPTAPSSPPTPSSTPSPAPAPHAPDPGSPSSASGSPSAVPEARNPDEGQARPTGRSRPEAAGAPVENPVDSPVETSSEPGAGDPAAGSGASAAAGATPGAGGLDVAAVRTAWPEVLEAVKRHRRVAWMILLNDVQIASVDRNTLTLAFSRDGDMKGWKSSGSDAALRRALGDVLGVDWRIEAISGGPGDGPRPSGPGPRGPAAPTGPPGGAPASGSGGPRPQGTSRAGGAGGGGGAAPHDAFGPGGTPAGPGSAPADRFSSASGAPSGAGVSAEAATSWPRAARPGASGPSGPSGFGPGAGAAAAGGAARSPGRTAVVDDVDEVDPEGDADADDQAAEVTGMALIQKELGGEIIDEIQNG
jgi:DNA polymerase III subunit gamma/tau